MKEKKTTHKGHFPWRVLAVLLFVLLALSSYMIARILVKSRQEQTALEELAQVVKQQTNQNMTTSTSPSSTEADSFDMPVAEPEKVILPHLASLYEQNSNLAGWLTVPGTIIDYPVMYTPDDPEYHLNHAFDGTKSQSGIPFIGEGANPESKYLIIHGHNMPNDTMFGSLDLYKSANFWEENPILRFDTLYAEQEFQVFAAVEGHILYQNETGFRYYQVPGDLSETQFADLIDWLSNHTMYDTGIVPAYEDQILILSTCSYHVKNGRFLVAAYKIK